MSIGDGRKVFHYFAFCRSGARWAFFIRIYILFCLILTYDFYAAISQSEAVFDAGSIFSMNIP